MTRLSQERIQESTCALQSLSSLIGQDYAAQTHNGSWCQVPACDSPAMASCLPLPATNNRHAYRPSWPWRHQLPSPHRPDTASGSQELRKVLCLSQAKLWACVYTLWPSDRTLAHPHRRKTLCLSQAKLWTCIYTLWPSESTPVHPHRRKTLCMSP